MKFSRSNCLSGFSLLASIALITTSASQASSTGYTDYVETAFGGAGEWSLWDVFPGSTPPSAASFGYRPADAGTSETLFSATFTGGIPGAMLFPDGQGTTDGSLYAGGAAVTFTFQGIAATAIDNLFFQVKQDVTPQDGEDPTPGLESLWTPVITWSGGTFEAVVAEHGDTFTDGSSDYSVTYWQFEDLNIAVGSQFSLSFALAGGRDAAFHQNVDGFRIDADGSINAVPEPTTVGLIAMGVAFLACKSRRRSTRI